MNTINHHYFLRRFLSPTVASVLACFLFAQQVFALDADVLPTGGDIVSGSGSIAQSGSAMTVTQTSDRMAANWDSFNIGSGAKVSFVQPGSSSVALNRIGGTSASQIFGTLTANGQVFLLNPAGVIFGAGSHVDVGGLVASSLDMSSDDFLAGSYVLRKGSIAGDVINRGTLTSAQGGYVALISPHVVNEGTIVTPQGTTALVAGDKVDVAVDAGSGLAITVDRGSIDALAENKGLLKANGGTVILTAKAADEIVRSAVNNSGVIEAKGLANKNGRIILDAEGGETTVGGTLDVSSDVGDAGSIYAFGDIGLTLKKGAILNAAATVTGNGGLIETSGGTVTIADVIDINTLAANGTTGTWLIDPYDIVVAANNGDVLNSTIATALNTTNVTIDTGTTTYSSRVGNGDITISDAIAKTGSSATTLTLKAHRDININAPISSNSGRLNVVLTADQDNNGTGDVNFGAAGSVVTNNGNFYVGSVSGTYDTVAASGQNFTMSTGSFIDVGIGMLNVSVNGNIVLPANAGQAVTYAMKELYNDGSVSYYRYFNGGNSVYYYYSPYQALKLTAGGSITSDNADATVADIVTSVDTFLTAQNIGSVGTSIRISGPANPYGDTSYMYNNKSFSNTAKTLYITNSVGSSYVNELGVQIFSSVNFSLGSQASKTQNVQIMGDQGGTGHIILNTDASGILTLLAGNVMTGGVPGTYGNYLTGSDPTVFPTSVSITAPNITFANGSVNTGAYVYYFYQGVGSYYKQNYGMASYGASFSAYGTSSLTSSQVDGVADIYAVTATLTSQNIGTAANPIEISGPSSLTLDNTGGSTYVKVTDNGFSNVSLYNRKTAGVHHIVWSGGDHIDYVTDGSGIVLPTIAVGGSSSWDDFLKVGLDLSQANRYLSLTAQSGYVSFGTNSVNTGSNRFTVSISNGNTDRSGGKAIFAANAKDNNAEITAGDLYFNIYDTTLGSISDIEIAKGGSSTTNLLNIYSYQGNVDIRELTENHFKSLALTFNGASAAQDIAIDLAGADDVHFTDSGTQLLIDGTKVALSSNNRNWSLNASSRIIQANGVSLSTGSYVLYAGNGLKLNGDILTNGGYIELTGGGSIGIDLLKTVRIDSNADDLSNTTSTGAAGRIRLSATVSGAASGYALTVDTSSSDTSGNYIDMYSGTSNSAGAYLSGLTLTSKGSTDTNDGLINLSGGTYYLDGNFTSIGNTYLYSQLSVDTEQGNDGNAGNITFGGYNVYNVYQGYTHTFNTSTTGAGRNAGNIDMFGTYAHSTITNAGFLLTATGGTGGSAGSITLPAISATTVGSANAISATGGIITLNGNLTTERGNVTLNGDIRLATNVTIDTWQSASTSYVNATAGSVTILGAGLSALSAGKSLTIDTSTNTGTTWSDAPTNTATWTQNAGAVSVSAATVTGGSFLNALTVNATASGSHNTGVSAAVTMNNIATTGTQTYSGTTGTFTGTMQTNGGNINVSGLTALAFGGTTAFKTDMTGGSGNAGTLNFGTNVINGAVALTLDTTADGAGNSADLTLNAVGGVTPLTALTVNAKAVTFASTHVGALNVQASGAVTQTGALAVTGLTTVTAGANAVTLTDATNDFDGGIHVVNAGLFTVSAADGITVVADNGLMLGDVDGGTGQLDISTLAGDLTISGDITTSDTTSSAVVLNAGENEAAETATGGNIIVDDGVSVTTGSDGRVMLYTGSVSGSTGLTAFVGSGSGKFRYGSDESVSNYDTQLASSGTYAVYRERPMITGAVADDSKTRDGTPYDDAALTAAGLSGFVNGDSAASAVGNLTFAGTGVGSTDAGTYALTAAPSGRGLGYAVSVTPGVLTIIQPQTNVVTAVVVPVVSQQMQTAANGTQTAAVSSGSSAMFSLLGAGAGSVSLTALLASAPVSGSILPAGYSLMLHPPMTCGAGVFIGGTRSVPSAHEGGSALSSSGAGSSGGSVGGSGTGGQGVAFGGSGSGAGGGVSVDGYFGGMAVTASDVGLGSFGAAAISTPAQRDRS